MNLSQIVEAVDGRLIGSDLSFSNINTDTRTLREGEVFVALKGENFNGAEYCLKAQELGASAVISDVESEGLTIPQIIVQDATLALGKMAKYKRQLLSASVVAITGSCGKTSVKAMLANVLAFSGKTTATKGNFNNHIGVPLTIMSAEGDEAYLVVEAGTSSQGEIAYLTNIIDPDVSVVTNIFSAHLEGLGCIENIATEKADIYKKGERDLISVVNEELIQYTEFAEQCDKESAIVFSPVSDTAKNMHGRNVSASNVDIDQLGFCQFSLIIGDESRSVKMSVPGRHQIANALAAAACAWALNIPLDQIVKGIEQYQGTQGRMHITPLKNGRLVDDSYNANPGSMAAAIDFLSACVNPVLVVGDMGELGDIVREAHQEVGRYAKEKGVQALFAVGQYAPDYIKGFGEGGQCFDSHQSISVHLISIMNDTTTVLVKGSRSSQMDRVCRELIQARGV